MAEPARDRPSPAADDLSVAADLLDALAGGDLDALRAALEAEPALAERPAPDGVSLLLHALYRRRQAATALILAVRPRLSTFDLAALGDAAALRTALASDVDERSPDDFTALHPAACAVAGRHLEVAALLIERGAAPDAAQAGGWTPLHSAAKQGNGALVELLLDHGGAPARASDEGLLPADLAAETRHGTIAARLREAARGAGLRPTGGG